MIRQCVCCDGSGGGSVAGDGRLTGSCGGHASCAGVIDGWYKTSSRRRLVGISAIRRIPWVGGDVGRIDR